MIADVGAVVAVLRLWIFELPVQHDVCRRPGRLAAHDSMLRRDDLVDTAVFGTRRFELPGLNLRSRGGGGLRGSVDDAFGRREADAQYAAIDLRFVIAQIDPSFDRAQHLKVADGNRLVERDQRLLSGGVRAER